MPPYASNLSYATLGQTYPMLDLPYAALCWICPTPVTYPTLPYANNLPTLTTYPTPSSLSVCELPLATTPSTPSPNLQVHERFLFRMVPHMYLYESIGPTAGCTNNDTQHTQAHDDVSLMLATFDTPMYLPNRCR